MGGPHAAAVAVIKRQMKTSAWPKSSNLKVKSLLASVSLTLREEIRGAISVREIGFSEYSL